MLKLPFVIYADFECILPPLQNGKNKTHHHEPCGYSYLVVSALDEAQREVVCYRGDNVVEHFFDDIIKESDYLLEHLKTNIPVIFTEEDEQVHTATNVHFICQEHMPPNDKVGDHCLLLESTEELHTLNATWHLNIPSLFQYFSTIWKDMILIYSCNILESTKR